MYMSVYQDKQILLIPRAGSTSIKRTLNSHTQAKGKVIAFIRRPLDRFYSLCRLSGSHKIYREEMSFHDFVDEYLKGIDSPWAQLQSELIKPYDVTLYPFDKINEVFDSWGIELQQHNQFKVMRPKHRIDPAYRRDELEAHLKPDINLYEGLSWQ